MSDRERLARALGGYSRLAVAFSGGVDSTLLAAAAARALGKEKVLLLFADSRFTPRSEADRARRWAEDAGLRFEAVLFEPLESEAVRSNPPLRCYHCKKLLMSGLAYRANELGFPVLADGANLDDFDDYRPGMRACDELGVVHPLLEAGFGKAAVRALAREYGLANWAAPAEACLASRIAYGDGITAAKLAMIEAAEEYLRGLGLAGVRARLRPDGFKIELSRDEDYPRLLERRTEAAAELRRLSGGGVWLDLAGYRHPEPPEF